MFQVPYALAFPAYVLDLHMFKPYLRPTHLWGGMRSLYFISAPCAIPKPTKAWVLISLVWEPVAKGSVKFSITFQLKSHLYTWTSRKFGQTRSALVFYLQNGLNGYSISMNRTWLAMVVTVANQKRNWKSWLGLFLQWDYNLLEGRDGGFKISLSQSR